MSTRKVMVLGLLVSMGLILHFVESMVPMTAVVPGAKLGLANIVSLISLVLYGFEGGIMVLAMRILIGSLLAGTFMTINFYLSTAGGIISFLAMYLSYRYLKNGFSLVGISVIGATFHNLGQIILAYYIIANPGIFYYLPFFVLLAVPTGIGVGLVSCFSINYLPGDLVKGG